MRSVFFSQSEANEGWAMNGEIKIQFGDGTENLYGRGTLLLTMARERQPLYPARIVAARVNNALTDLQVGQKTDAAVEFFDLKSGQGMKVYERSLTFVLIVAAQRLYPSVTAPLIACM